MDPVVDVNIAVYNHARFLHQTLDSVLSQQTSFPFRLIVGDDCSTDGSIEILKEYQEKFPDKIHLILQPKNLGLNALERNGIVILKKSTAKYIALLDGDDFWIDPLKLQKQVEFLEKHSEFVLCGGNSRVIYEDYPSRIEYIRPDWTECTLEVITIEEQIKYDAPFQTSTAVFRNILDWSKLSYFPTSGDIVIFTLLAEKGDLFYMNEILSAYRVHSGGASNSPMTYSKQHDRYAMKIKFYNSLNRLLKNKYSRLYTEHIQFYNKRLFNHFIKGGRIDSLLIHLLKNFANRTVLSSFLSVVLLKIRNKTFN